MAQAKKKKTTTNTPSPKKPKKPKANSNGPKPNPHMPQIKVCIAAAILDGSSKKASIRAAGITKQTFYNWLKADPDFQSNIDMALGSVDSNMEIKLKKCAMMADQDPKYLKALIYYLDKRMNYEHMNDVPEEDADSKVSTINVVLHDPNNSSK